MCVGTKRTRHDETERFALFSCVDHPSQRFEANLIELSGVGCMLVQRVERDPPDFYDDDDEPVWRSGLARAVLISVLESAKYGYLVVSAGATASEVVAAVDFLSIVFKNRPPHASGYRMACAHEARERLAGEMHAVAERIARCGRLSDWRPPSVGTTASQEMRAKKEILRLDTGASRVDDQLRLSRERVPSSLGHTRVVVQFVHPPTEIGMHSPPRDQSCPFYLTHAIGSFMIEAFDALPDVDWASVVHDRSIVVGKRGLVGVDDFRAVRRAIKLKYHGDSMLPLHVHDIGRRGQKLVDDAVFWINNVGGRRRVAPPAYEPAPGTDTKFDVQAANAGFCQNVLLWLHSRISAEPDLAALLSADVADEDGVTTPARTELAAALSGYGCRVVRWRDDIVGGANAMAFPAYFDNPAVPALSSPAVVLELT